jgi:hypothetical protein
MTPFAQNLFVLLIVGGCLAYIGWQILQALRGRKSKVGSCCAKGCAGTLAEQSMANATATPRVQFLPLESLARKRVKP